MGTDPGGGFAGRATTQGGLLMRIVLKEAKALDPDQTSPKEAWAALCRLRELAG